VSAHSVKRHLDVDADGYDVQIRRLIPHYNEMISTGVEVLQALAPADAHVLDLGGGTGALSAAVLDGLPGVRITLLDVDPDMLAELREDNQQLAANMRETHDLCGEQNDVASTSLIEIWIDEAERRTWFRSRPAASSAASNWAERLRTNARPASLESRRPP